MRRGIKRSSLFDDDGKSPEGKKTAPATEITSFDISQENDKVKEPKESIFQEKPSSPVMSDLAKIIELREKKSFEEELRDVIKNNQYEVPSAPSIEEDSTLHKRGKEWLLAMGWDFDANPQNPIQLVSQRPQFLGLGAKIQNEEEERDTFTKIPKKNKPVDEIFKSKRIQQGEYAYIIKGIHGGLTGHILEFNKEEAKVIFKLEISGVIVELDKNQISTEPHHSKIIPDELELLVGDWIRLGMKVRIVSRTWDNGIHYWKRSHVMDILPTGDEIVVKIEGESSLCQTHKSNIAPLPPYKVGDVVMVISPTSKYKELHGRVTFLNQSSITVQLLDDGKFINVHSDELCLLEIDY
jgi:hypothetical protein